MLFVCAVCSFMSGCVCVCVCVYVWVGDGVCVCLGICVCLGSDREFKFTMCGVVYAIELVL